MGNLSKCLCAECFLGEDIAVMDMPFGRFPVFTGNLPAVRGFRLPAKPKEKAE